MKKPAALSLLLIILPSFSFAAEDVMQDLRNKMRYLNNRQSVISQNIANANTPGFKAMDVEPSGFGKGNTLQLANTSPMHISSSGARGNFKKVKDRDTYETAPNGNNVSIEEQMIKMSDTDKEYETTTNILRQMGGLVRTAVGAR
jgi:flagellar basal-body rod protein FlgB